MTEPNGHAVPPTLDTLLQVEHLRRRLDDQTEQMRELTEVLRLVTDGQRRSRGIVPRLSSSKYNLAGIVATGSRCKVGSPSGSACSGIR